MFKRRKRRRLREAPFPDDWRAILENRVAYYHRLTPGERAELRGHIQVFLAEKGFEGCGGQEISDEIRVTIAALACVLLLNRETDYFPLMQTVLVYPRHYLVPAVEELEGGIVSEEMLDFEGESWHRGPVVLSWEDVGQDASDAEDGYNVVFHEFAHQLDSESGAEDGAPPLPERSQAAEWARVLGQAYEELIDDIEKDRPHLIDEYGATSPAEFFAVVTELFFESPSDLNLHHPELYGQFKGYYRQDPEGRFDHRSDGHPPGDE
jgi:Mlc titration factor MtfA (ptsG expression regulator)